MLNNLFIKDYALIEELEVEFHSGLNIITGETGAGKSILLGALGLILGERANTDVIRKGSAKSIVEAHFDVRGNEKLKTLLAENEIEFAEQMIVRREISQKGSNRCFINDTPVNLNLVKDVGDLIVDLHGQHEHQSLLKVDSHIEVLDEIGDYSELLVQFSLSKNQLDSFTRELNDLKKRESLLKEKKDLYSFQIKEIDAISPEAGEEESLNEELRILENSERLLELTTDVYSRLFENEDSLYDAFVDVQKEIEELTDIDKSFAEKNESGAQVVEMINDIAEFVRSYRDKVEMDPERLEEVRSRLGSFNLLKKKYGGSLEKVIEYRSKIAAELDIAENFAERIASLQNHIRGIKITCGKIAAELSRRRNDFALKLKHDVESELKSLGIANANFEIEINQIETGNESSIIVNDKYFQFDNYGIDKIEFYISTNLGEDPKPLAKIASGGEISRIMLALKTILAKTDKLPLLIFDEIDVGISGKIAQKVGYSLQSLSRFHQIIAITHLPQIAALADFHYLVQKTESMDRVISRIIELDFDTRINEVAKLISGEELTTSAIQSAKELINGA
ncbi:MAG: DNA repair protein RecN [Melioribacteraceae bacterium]|nr:DNA repair protein RecN [Melioribacteraceae bacterium]